MPKVLLGAILGYFGGKISYQDKCVEKIMSLPDSKLAEVLRQRKGGTLPNSQDRWTFSEALDINSAIYSNNLDLISPCSLPRVSVPEVDSYPSAATNVQTESFNEMRSADLSFDAPPTMVGLDDSSRPSVDSIILSDEALPPPSQSTTSYEELRHRNRQNYELKKAEYYQQSSPVPSEASPVPAMSPAPKLRGDVGKKNAYGDVWED